MFNDASLSASPSTAESVKVSPQEENSELSNVTSNTFHKGVNLTDTNHFDKLPPEIQSEIIKLCIPKRDACRVFEIYRAPYNLIYLVEKRGIQYTRILSVSKVFRDIYLKHLPIMLPSFTDKPIYTHQDTTVILDMNWYDFCDLAECTRRRRPAFFSQIRHLAIPLLLFGSCPHDFYDCSVARGICHERVDVIVSWGILILACSNLQSLTAIQARVTDSELLGESIYDFHFWHFKRCHTILEGSLKSLQNFLHLQQFIGIYSYIKPTYHLIAERNMNKEGNIGQDILGDREHLKMNKPNVDRILHIEIDSFISNFEEDFQRRYLSIVNSNTYRDFLQDFYFTYGTEKLFKADEKFEDNENNKKSMKRIREAYTSRRVYWR
ncbi:hypothetical protein OCU04_010037 [Sclerotinia nivalis]|uniref:Uncharacterized protein n=1 Tax=Sclerotinia nivalis TaxID=352851 RepID=A0A9X0AHB6_9HELO|nr:hypothetical protein OCU04_010037 [Sclerotinia nivalis]